MRKLILLGVTLCLLLMAAAPVAGAENENLSDAVTVSVSGDGTWTDGCWFVTLFPGETKEAVFEFQNNLDIPLHVGASTDPSCVGDDACLIACFHPTEFTLPASGNYTGSLNVTANGSATPGAYSVNVTIETDTVIPEPEPEPEPDPDPDPEPDLVPHHIVLLSSYDSRAVGDEHRLTATVYNESDVAVADADVSWSIPNGGAEFLHTDPVTNGLGVATAEARADTPGTVVISCESAANPTVSDAVTIIWVAASNGNGNGIEPEPESSGIPGWVVFLISLLVAAAGWGTYRVISHRREEAKRAELEVLTDQENE